MTYIKLGKKGQGFFSKKYNLFLQKGNASEVSQELLYTDLHRFIITGFFVEITHNEYEQIRNSGSNNPKVNYAPQGINSISVVEPVDNIMNTPPNAPEIASRFLVGAEPTGIFAQFRNQIVEYAGFDTWVPETPENGVIIPIKELGIAAVYNGTYPSGVWDIDYTQTGMYIEDILNAPEPVAPEIDIPPTSMEIVMSAIEQEREERISAQELMFEQISRLAPVELPDRTSTFTQSELNASFPDATIGFEVLCPRINRVYKKFSTVWKVVSYLDF